MKLTKPLRMFGNISALLGPVAAALVVILASVAVWTPGASARPPRCDDEASTCPERPGPGGGDTDPESPQPQPEPPAPYWNASQLDYGDLALLIDIGTLEKLEAPPPPDDEPWPLPSVPFTPKQSGMPVRVTQVTEDVWAFTARYDVNGMAFDASMLGRTSTPWFGLPILTQYSSGLYQAQLTIDPTLDIELWTVSYQPGNWPTRGQWVPIRLAEVTATLHMLAVAHCDGWEVCNQGALAWSESRLNIDTLRIAFVIQYLDTTTTGWGEVTASTPRSLIICLELAIEDDTPHPHRLPTDLGVGRHQLALKVDRPLLLHPRVRGDAVDGALARKSRRCPPSPPVPREGTPASRL